MKTERLTRIRNAIYGQPWAIMQDHLEAICEIFERHVSMDSETLEARIIEVLAKSGVGQHFDNPGFQCFRIHGDVALKDFADGFQMVLHDGPRLTVDGISNPR